VTGSRAGRRQVLPAAGLSAEQLARTELVYQQAFPAHLRVPFDELAMPSPADLMLVAIDGPEPVGFAAMKLLEQARWTFLRYYGIAWDRRREGVGQWFWQRLPPAVIAAGWPARIVFEVEDPRDAVGDDEELRVRTGRISFWERCGARLLPVDGYVMPDLAGLATPEPMRLMTFDSTSVAELGPAELAALVIALYTERYGLSASHPLALQALASIER
jgi:hypothetical protein